MLNFFVPLSLSAFVLPEYSAFGRQDDEACLRDPAEVDEVEFRRHGEH